MENGEITVPDHLLTPTRGNETPNLTMGRRTHSGWRLRPQILALRSSEIASNSSSAHSRSRRTLPSWYRNFQSSTSCSSTLFVSYAIVELNRCEKESGNNYGPARVEG